MGRLWALTQLMSYLKAKFSNIENTPSCVLTVQPCHADNSSHNNIIKNNISLNKVYTLNLKDDEWGVCGIVAVMRALHNPK